MEAPEPTTTIPIASIDCVGLFLGRTPEFSEMDGYLAPGFVAEDAGTLFAAFGIDTGAIGRALVAVIANSCEGDHTYDWLAFWILVEEPTVEGVEPLGGESLHWFEVASYYDNFPDLGALQNWTLDVHEMDVRRVGADFGAFTGWDYNGTNEEDVIFHMINFGAVQALTLDHPMAAWQVNDNGTFRQNMDLTAIGDSGTGTCFSTIPWVNELTAECTDGQLLLGTIRQLSYQGQFEFYAGVKPA